MTHHQFILISICVLCSLWSSAQTYEQCEISPELENEFDHLNNANLDSSNLPEDQNCVVQVGAYTRFPEDGNTASICATLVSISNPNAGYYLEIQLNEGQTWDEWSNQDFPTSYRDDSGMAGDNYLDWTYHLFQEGSLTGWGEWAGAQITLEHSPPNDFYAFQVGTYANSYNSNFGAGTWLTGSGTYFNSTIDQLVPAPDLLYTLYFDFGDCSTLDQTDEFDITTIPDIDDLQHCTITGIPINGLTITENSSVNITQVTGCEADIITSIDGEVTIENLQIGENQFLITDEDLCGNLVEHYMSINVTPCLGENVECEPFSAGDDIELLDCQLTPELQLEGEISCNLTGTWTLLQGAGEFSNENDPNSNFTSVGIGINTLLWSTVCNGTELVDTVEVIVYSYQPDIPNAGDNIEGILCEGELTLSLNGSQLDAPSMGFWNVIEGPPVQFEDSTLYNTNVTFSQPGAYTLEWGFISLCNDFIADNLEITVFDETSEPLLCPNPQVYELCSILTLELQGIAPPNVEAFWIQPSGPTVSLSDNNIPNPTVEFTEEGVYVFRYQYLNECGNLIFCDQFITILECPNQCEGFSAGLDQEIQYCCTQPENIGLQGNLAGSVSPTWYVYTGTGDILNPNDASTLVSLGEGENCYILTAQCNAQNIQDTVCVNSIQSCPELTAGSDQEHYLCEGAISAQLQADELPNNAQGFWEIVSGNEAIIETPDNEISEVEILEPGDYEFSWTYTDQCGDENSDNMIITVLPEYTVPEDCGGIEELDVIPLAFPLSAEGVPEGYFGLWVQSFGEPVSIENTFNPETEITGLDYGTYTFIWTVSSEECEAVQLCTFGLIIEDPNPPGCTIQSALNYNADAIVDDGTCEFDFTICDCSGNTHSPYVTIELGDGAPNVSGGVDFNCPNWGYDCGDIDGAPQLDPYDVCNGFLPPPEDCACIPMDLTITLGEEYMQDDECLRTLYLTPIIQGDCRVEELCYNYGNGFSCNSLPDLGLYYYSGDIIEFDTSADEQNIEFYFTTSFEESSIYSFYNPECTNNIEDPLEIEFEIYPNPNNGIFSIQLNNPNPNLTIRLYNTAGQLVHTTLLKENSRELNIDMSNVNSGLYLLELEGLNKISRKSLLVTKP